MQDRKSTTQKRLMQEFQQINADVAEEIDIKIKTKVLAYESSDFNRDISEEIQKEIKKHAKVKNLKLIKKKSNKLAKEYLENNRIWILQENWYCLLAYFITIATMILRCVEVKTKMNDIIYFGIYFITLILWTLIVKRKEFMSSKMERFFIAFNNQASCIIVISSILFYLVVCVCTCRYIWVAVIVLSFLGCMLFTYLWYKRERIYMDT